MGMRMEVKDGDDEAARVKRTRRVHHQNAV